MAFKSINHDDEKIFYNRLWKLMEERNLSTARELAQALYAEEIVPVDLSLIHISEPTRH